MNNVRKGGYRENKYDKLWAKNAFDKGRRFWGFDIKKCMIDLYENEDTMKSLVDASLICPSMAKQDGKLYLLARNWFKSLFGIMFS